MKSTPRRSLPISEECALKTILPYADAYVEGNLLPKRSIAIFEVYTRSRTKFATKRFVLAARWQQGPALAKALPPSLRGELTVLSTAAADVREVFRAMAKARIRVGLLPLPGDGAALFVQGELGEGAAMGTPQSREPSRRK